MLWALSGVIVASLVLNVAIAGAAALSWVALAPNTAFLLAVVLAASLNGRGAVRGAVGVVAGLVLLTTTLQLALVGIPGNSIGLFLTFVPVVLTGLVLGRRALLGSVAWVLATVAAAVALQRADLLLLGPVRPDDPLPMALQFSLVLVIVAFFLDRFGGTLIDALHAAAEGEARAAAERERRDAADAALVAEQGFTRAVIEALPGLFAVMDDDGRLVRWNENVERLTGRTSAELAGADATTLVAPMDVARFEAALAGALEGGEAVVAVPVGAAGGARVPHVFSVRRVPTPTGPHVAVVGIDRSEVEAATDRIDDLTRELRVRIDRLTALQAIDQAIIGSEGLDATLAVVLEQVRRHLRVDGAAVLLVDASGSRLRFGAQAGFRGAGVRATDVGVGEGLAGAAAALRRRVAVHGEAEFAARFKRVPLVEEEGFAAYVAVPLVARGAVQGVLELFHRGPLPFDDDASAFLDALATQGAIAVHHTTLLDGLERSNEELRQAYDTTIEGWARALDLRDEETEGHSRRVTELAVRLGERLGMDDDALLALRWGALLHDIGKMGVPDRVLLKPGPLTPEERALIERHPEYARALLAPIAFLSAAVDVPFAHHERWDGRGYPRRLAGEAIPLAARVFAVVDVYDALTSDRPYRSAWSRERTLEHLREESGRHFDPRVLEAFMDLLDDEGANAEPVG